MSSLAKRAAQGRAILLAGVFINLLLALVKMSAGWFGHSDALIADGLESTLDVLSSALIWLALKYAERPPDSEHPYGHGKMESLAAVAGALIFAVKRRFQAEMEGKVVDRSAHTLQQYKSGFAKQQLLPEPKRTTAQGNTVAAKVLGTTQKSI